MRNVTRLLLVIGFVVSCLGLVWVYAFSDHSSISMPRSSWKPFSGAMNKSPQSSPVLGLYKDPAMLYYPSVSISKHLRVAEYNQPPHNHTRTPLFIGFTQNNGMLSQTVLSYLAIGWPPEDIVVVDNSGTLDANPLGKLSSGNPLFLDYSWLHSVGVSVLQTPTLLTFAQLQNFYLRTALSRGWPYFFWSHMDVVVLSDEGEKPFKPFYQGILDVIEQVRGRDDWALKWFSYDTLTMINPEAWRKIGQWDVFIPYYHADCDMYSRMVLAGYNRAAADAHVGSIFDLAATVENLEQLLFPASGSEVPNSTRYQELRSILEKMERAKKENKENKGGRNTWQAPQGPALSTEDEMWSYRHKAFRWSWWRMAEKGKEIYKQKWGTTQCNLDGHGITLGQMWKNVPD